MLSSGVLTNVHGVLCYWVASGSVPALDVSVALWQCLMLGGRKLVAAAGYCCWLALTSFNWRNDDTDLNGLTGSFIPKVDATKMVSPFHMNDSKKSSVFTLRSLLGFKLAGACVEFSFKLQRLDVRKLFNFQHNCIPIPFALKSICWFHLVPETKIEIDRITRIISDHPFPDAPLQPTLLHHIPPPTLSGVFVENVLGHLFAAHTNGFKAYEFFKFSFQFPHLHPTFDAFEKTLHILT
ncbi:hypothetical protein Ancab_029438 [Ancistrocladus abbreviatus]